MNWNNVGHLARRSSPTGGARGQGRCTRLPGVGDRLMRTGSPPPSACMQGQGGSLAPCHSPVSRRTRGSALRASISASKAALPRRAAGVRVLCCVCSRGASICARDTLYGLWGRRRAPRLRIKCMSESVAAMRAVATAASARRPVLSVWTRSVRGSLSSRTDAGRRRPSWQRQRHSKRAGLRFPGH